MASLYTSPFHSPYDALVDDITDDDKTDQLRYSYQPLLQPSPSPPDYADPPPLSYRSSHKSSGGGGGGGSDSTRGSVRNPFPSPTLSTGSRSSTGSDAYGLSSHLHRRSAATTDSAQDDGATRKRSFSLRRFASTVAHPRRRRTEKRMEVARMERERIREIEDFLETGRGGPRRFSFDAGREDVL
jgi:hypothetical protein